jgi:hypothetical protein
MKLQMSGFLSIIFLSLLIFIATASYLTGPSRSEAAWKKDGATSFDSHGQLMLPSNYRHWIFVGAPVTPNDMNGGKADFPEFHDVYISPHAFAVYGRTGKFPDGTVMVKELVSVGAKKAPSGSGYFPGDFNGVAASVKDSKRFPKEPGHWAYFNFMGPGGKKLTKAMAQPTAACNACHQKYAADDWVFAQFYPVLRAVKSAK